jgi:hypothetical protein
MFLQSDTLSLRSTNYMRLWTLDNLGEQQQHLNRNKLSVIFLPKAYIKNIFLNMETRSLSDET